MRTEARENERDCNIQEFIQEIPDGTRQQLLMVRSTSRRSSPIIPTGARDEVPSPAGGVCIGSPVILAAGAGNGMVSSGWPDAGTLGVMQKLWAPSSGG